MEAIAKVILFISFMSSGLIHIPEQLTISDNLPVYSLSFPLETSILGSSVNYGMGL